MKRLLLLPLICALVSGAAWAGKGNSSGDELPNGRPFQILDERISELTERLTTLEGEVGSITSDISGLQSQIDENRAAISDLLGTVGLLASDVDALRADQQAKFDLIQGQIGDINGRIDELHTKLAEAKADLEADIAEGDAGLLALITSLQTELAQALTDLGELEGAQSDLEAQIAGLQLQIDALEGRVDTLEGYHVQLPQPCDSGQDPGTNADYVVCEADQDGAWVSADNFGQFHAELICQELGYRTAGVYAGTCGNVCGRCQGPTSCESPGIRPEQQGAIPISNFNCGTDALGNLVCNTVHWTCIN